MRFRILVMPLDVINISWLCVSLAPAFGLALKYGPRVNPGLKNIVKVVPVHSMKAYRGKWRYGSTYS